MLGKSNWGMTHSRIDFACRFRTRSCLCDLVHLQAVFLINNAAAIRQTDDQTNGGCDVRRGYAYSHVSRRQAAFRFSWKWKWNENASFHALFVANSRKFPEIPYMVFIHVLIIKKIPMYVIVSMYIILIASYGCLFSELSPPSVERVLLIVL